MVNLQDKLSHHGCHYIVSELIAGGFAGVFGWVTATPLDVVKSRIQASEGKVKLVPVIKELYREEGKSYIGLSVQWFKFQNWLIAILACMLPICQTRIMARNTGSQSLCNAHTHKLNALNTSQLQTKKATECVGEFQR